MLQQINDPLLKKLARVHGNRYGRGRNPNSIAALRRTCGNGKSRDTWRGKIKGASRGPQVVRDLFAAINEAKIPLATIERRAGVSRKTIGHWRRRAAASVDCFIAVANTVGYDLALVKRVGKLSLPPDASQILDEVSAETALPPAVILGRCRTARTVAARDRFISRLSSELALSSTAIGKMIGRDHTTILSSLGRTKRPRARLGVGE